MGWAAAGWVEAAPEELARALAVPEGAEARVRAADCGSLVAVAEAVVQQVGAGEDLAGEVDPAVGVEAQAAEQVVDLEREAAQGAGVE